MRNLFARLVRGRREGVAAAAGRPAAPGREPSRVALRPAVMADIPFVAQIVVGGARDGHFHPACAADELHRRFLADNLEAVLAYGLWQRSLEPPVAVGAHLHVYDVDDRPVGFVLLAEWEPGSSEGERPEYELYMLGVVPSERGKGHGATLTSVFLRAVPPAWTLHARCYPASQRMFEILQRRGFVHDHNTPAGTRVLTRRGA